MKTRFLGLACTLALASIAAVGQNQAPAASSQTGQTSQTETQNNTAGSIAGNASQTNANPGAKPGTVNPNSQDPTTPTVDKTTPTTPQSGQSPNLPQNSASPENSQVPPGSFGVTPSSELKSQLDNAYQSEPTLSGANIQTNVTDTTVELSGTVPTGKEKTTAKRIAQSYSGNRKVVDRLTVTGRGTPNAQPAPSGATTPHNQGSTSNATPTNPDQAPQGSKPLQKGDASAVPQH